MGCVITSSAVPTRRLVPTCQQNSHRPPKSCSEAAAQARASIRAFREAAVAEGGGGAAAAPLRATVRLPFPSPGESDDLVRNFDEGDWPGGVQQQFRALRPLVERALEGYAQFLGMLEAPEDGIGVWVSPSGGITGVAQVSNATFAPFARLCAGQYGSRVNQPGHLLIVFNPTWTCSADLFQFWQSDLKAQAAALIDPPAAWQVIYHLEDVRTSSGATGLVYKSYPGPWQLWDTNEREAHDPGEMLLESEARPGREQLKGALNAAGKEARQRQRDGGGGTGRKAGWWGL